MNQKLQYENLLTVLRKNYRKSKPNNQLLEDDKNRKMLGQYYKQKKRNRLKLNNYTEENFNLLNTLLYI